MLAEALASEPRLEPVLVVTAAALREGIPATFPPRVRVVDASDAVRSPRFRALRLLGRLLRRAGLQLCADIVQTYEGVSRGRWIARTLPGLDRDAAAVLVADDRDIRVDAGVLRHARSLGVFTMSVAFGKSDPAAESVPRRKPVYQLERGPWKGLKARIARDYPRSVHMVDGQGATLFLRPGEYLALRFLDALLPYPWSYGGGPASKVTVTDGAAAENLRRAGIPRDKILVAGQCTYDSLHAARERRHEIRAALYAEHRLAADKPLVILAMPALGQYDMSSPDEQKKDAQFLFATLAQTPANALISLHPRHSAAEYEPLAAQHGVAIARAPLRDILPAADVFVAYSSTLAWAQLLEIPGLALEYYGLGFKLFAGEPGVVLVQRRDDLHRALTDVLTDVETRRALKEALRRHLANLPFDGQARRRIIDAILARADLENAARPPASPKGKTP